MIDKPNAFDISVRLSEYCSNIAIFKQRQYIHLIFVLLAIVFVLLGFNAIFCFGSMLIAFFLFIKRIHKKKKLSKNKTELLNELDKMASMISMENYFTIKQNIINAGRR
jgi:hypothetical protein